MNLLFSVIEIGAAAGLLLALVSYICYRMVYLVPRKPTLDPYDFPKGSQYRTLSREMHSLVDSAAALEGKDVYTVSFDGLKLHGKYYETAPGAPVQILFHGYRSNAVRDFSGGLQLALKSGHNALLIDERAHGKSEGRCLSFGILERQDCLSWIRYVNRNIGFDTSIILTGISMGAATILMASGLRLPANVKGIIADSGYTSPEAIIRKVMVDRHYPPALTYPFVQLGGYLYGGFDLREADALRALQNCQVPVLFIHGEDDRFVPCKMTLENYAHCASDKTLLTIPAAGHGLSYLVDEPKYIAAVNAFLKKVLE